MLIGSKAAKYWFPDFREPKDTDYIAKDKIVGADCKFCPGFQYILDKYQGNVAPPIVLYTLKLSHAQWDVHWLKTVSDLAWFQNKGITEVDEELYKISIEDWNQIHYKKRAYLNTTNEDFFNDAVKRKYVHDSIHKAVSYDALPGYEKIKKDKDKALTSEKLFNVLTFEEKCQIAREEIYVTALERFLIPRNFRTAIGAAYIEGAKQLICYMSKGWFPRFILSHWNILRKADVNYLKKFELGLEKKIIEAI